MCRTRRLCTRFFGFTTAILASVLIAITAVGQNASAADADCSAYASIPLPAEAENVPALKTSPACASYRSYRGIGRPVNYSEARACAWQERLAHKAGLGQNEKEPIAWVVGGSLILADIYFNGAGVKRDIPLSMRFACEFEKSAATFALPEITKLNDSLKVHGPFEFCDQAATTFTMNFCSGYQSEIADDRRSRYYNSLKPSMTADQRAAFDKLLAAKNAYIQAHASEVYQGGTIRNMRTLGSQDILNDLFRTEVVHFEAKKWPELSDKQIAISDALLQREYEKKVKEVRTRTKGEIEDGVVTADGLTTAEKVWETYRDAWVAFARLRYPAAADAVRAEITRRRCAFVKTID
jgi:hypothetical protein